MIILLSKSWCGWCWYERQCLHVIFVISKQNPHCDKFPVQASQEQCCVCRQKIVGDCVVNNNTYYHPDCMKVYILIIIWSNCANHGIISVSRVRRTFEAFLPLLPKQTNLWKRFQGREIITIVVATMMIMIMIMIVCIVIMMIMTMMIIRRRSSTALCVRRWSRAPTTPSETRSTAKRITWW